MDTLLNLFIKKSNIKINKSFYVVYVYCDLFSIYNFNIIIDDNYDNNFVLTIDEMKILNTIGVKYDNKGYNVIYFNIRDESRKKMNRNKITQNNNNKIFIFDNGMKVNLINGKTIILLENNNDDEKNPKFCIRYPIKGESEPKYDGVNITNIEKKVDKYILFFNFDSI